MSSATASAKRDIFDYGSNFFKLVYKVATDKVVAGVSLQADDKYAGNGFYPLLTD